MSPFVNPSVSPFVNPFVNPFVSPFVSPLLRRPFGYEGRLVTKADSNSD